MGCLHILEVELRLGRLGRREDGPGDDPGEHDFTKFFPEFREKGVITIADRGDCDTVPGDGMSEHFSL